MMSKELDVAYNVREKQQSLLGDCTLRRNRLVPTEQGTGYIVAPVLSTSHWGLQSVSSTVSVVPDLSHTALCYNGMYEMQSTHVNLQWRAQSSRFIPSTGEREEELEVMASGLHLPLESCVVGTTRPSSKPPLLWNVGFLPSFLPIGLVIFLMLRVNQYIRILRLQVAVAVRILKWWEGKR